MNTLKITKECLETLQYLSGGSEGKVYYDNDKAYKVYKNIDDDMIRKIEIFNKLNFEYTTTPLRYLKVDGKTVGYMMDFKKGYYPISNAKHLSLEKRYELLIKLKDILDNLHYNDVSYNDLGINNILTNDDDVYLCDIVSADYYPKGLKSTKVDNYMFNLVTVYLLNDNLEFDDVKKTMLESLRDFFNKNEYRYLNGVHDNEECMNIVYDMLDSKKGTNFLLIDFLDKDKYKNPTK